MALKLISSEEAAELLGVSQDRLTELRQRQEIFGYRDGTNWKYKQDDVERLVKELRGRAEAGEGMPDSDELLDLPLDLGEDDASDVVLLSEHELGESEPSTSSTIIGRPGTQSPEESDIRIITDEDRQAEAAGSSDVRLVPSDPSTPDSDVKLVAEQVTVVPPPGSHTTSHEETVESGSGSDISLDDDAMELSLDLGDDDFSFATEATPVPQGSTEQAKASDSAVELGGDEDDEMVLRDPSGSSDITLSAADSGISLASLSDSGLSLEEPLDLAGGGEESLELGADDMLSLSDDSDSAEVRDLQVDDDFLLTPMEEVGDEASSGSQVIALDSDSDFGDVGLATEGDAGLGMMLEEDTGEADSFDTGEPVAAGLGSATSTAAVAAAPLAAREPQYTVLNVVSLSICVFLLMLTGMMMFDMIVSMWSWDTPYAVNSTLMDTILNILPF